MLGLPHVRVARRRTVATVLLVALTTTACQTAGTLIGIGVDPKDRPVPHGTLEPTAAAAALQGLAIAPFGGLDGYDRDCGPGDGCVYGPAWTDDVDVEGGRNGCDTRNDVLNRDLQAGQIDGVAVPKRHRQAGSCTVVEGVLDDPYTGRLVHFVKDDAGLVQIDHVVALAAAWRAGAANWDQRRRQNFANDPRNLLAVHGPTNQAKGDATIDEWLPPNGAYHCEYARIVVTIKSEYGLTVTAIEQAALRSALGRCPQPTPTTGG